MITNILCVVVINVSLFPSHLFVVSFFFFWQFAVIGCYRFPLSSAEKWETISEKDLWKPEFHCLFLFVTNLLLTLCLSPHLFFEEKNA